MGLKSYSFLITMMCKVLTLLKEGVPITLSRTTLGLIMLVPRTTLTDLSTALLPEDSPLTGLLCCKCEMPYNPDDLMVQCEGCKDWFHSACVEMTIKEAKRLDCFLCSEYVDEGKKPESKFSTVTKVGRNIIC